MHNAKRQFHLSTEAFTELKQIALEVFGEDIPDAEISEIGLRLLQLFSVFSSGESLVNSTTRQKTTPNQFKGLKYIHQSIYHEEKQPTVRGIAQAIGLRSSRSGLRLLHEFMKQGFVFP